MVPNRLIVAWVISLAAILPAAAAPFCVEVEGLPLQCLYVDPGQCQQEATRLGGRCAANPSELNTPMGRGRFCIVEAIGAISCIYPDRATCDAESSRRNTACIAATAPAPKVTPAHDPFAIRRPY